MLDTETRRRIDTARDILVGKVPDPKSQVEQITIALIYKFMDDMDAESEELGGKRKFFTGKFAQYGWPKLMHSGLGGHEVLALYSEGLNTMPSNPGIPPLFRDIFKNAYLPYRDPETLKSFLKIIDGFTYDHSERLGDAFEYLLSVLGSQGDAGQFRTPRHIIDFIVSIVDPKKGDVILDPACGTAGFLISAYKHILKASKDEKKQLTPDERLRLAKNLKGYDISPDMVRLSLVNLYLHGFTNPSVLEYDTLTSEERWNEYADVILANPPFMSPKGGIRPHKRFSIDAKRSEVLFVDYIAEHLTPNGRAGIIVPEGIIFQSGTAYKKLRKMLVDTSLVAVISLPAGMFNPYSGVKTSVLILDKALAKQIDTIGFFKIESDGFGLGAQRRATEKDDIPQVRDELKSYITSLRAEKPTRIATTTNALIIPKKKIAANGDYNLSGERYRDGVVSASQFPTVNLGKVCELVRGVVFAKEDEVLVGGVKVLRANNINKDRSELDLSDIRLVEPKKDFSTEKKLRRDDIFICLASGSKDHIGKAALITEDTDFYFGGFMGSIRVNRDRINSPYLFRQLTSGHFNDFLREQIAGASINNLSSEILYRFEIPLPPIATQEAIVAEIEGYQKVINGARAVLDNYRPHIPIDPNWQKKPLGSLVTFSSGGTPSKANSAFWSGDIPWVSAKDMKQDVLTEFSTFVSDAAVAESATRIAQSGSLLILVRGMGLANGVPICEVSRPCAFNQDLKAMLPNSGVEATFLRHALNQEKVQFKKILETAAHGTLKIDTDDLVQITVPLPPLATQQAIVAEIEAEQTLVAANRELIARFERKIQATLARIWGDGEADSLRE